MDNYLKSNYILEERTDIEGIPSIIFRPKETEELLPTLILYHGWSSQKEFQRMRGFILASVGYQVLIPDAIYHGERNPLSNYDIDNAGAYFWDVIFNNMEESSTIIHELISKYDADPSRIGVIGHSMGGFTASGVFTHNPGLRTLVVFNGSCNWQSSNEMFQDSLKLTNVKGLKKTIEKVAEMDPINNMHLLKDRPILLLHGEKDTSVPIESQRIFYNRIKPIYEDKHRIRFVEYPNLNHFVTTNMMEESIAWLYKFLYSIHQTKEQNEV